MQADILWVETRHLEREAARHAPYLANLTASEKLFELRCPRVVRPHEAVHQPHAATSAVVDDFLRLFCGRGQRLLAQDMFTLVGRFHRPFRVQRVRKRNIDGIDFLIIEQRLIPNVCPRNMPFPGSGPSTFQRPAGDGGNFRVRGTTKRRQQAPIDASHAKNAPAELAQLAFSAKAERFFHVRAPAIPMLREPSSPFSRYNTGGLAHADRRGPGMCLLALFYRVVEDAAIVAGANREEAYARGGEPPAILDGTPRVVAGIDPRGGGTWFGVNERGVLIAVTNRPKSQLPAQPRSRGLLARDLLACPSAGAAAVLAARELSQERYAGCNILCADAQGATVLHAADWLRIRPLPPGLHVLTAADVNDFGDRRLGHAAWWLQQRSYASAQQCVEALKELCPQRGDPDPPMCVYGKEGGTVSSSIVALRSSLERSTYLHAQGPPDKTPYADYSLLLRQLAAK